MNIDDKRTLSFEVFPPNTEIGAAKLIDTLDNLKKLNPDFISVTCSNNKNNIEETTIKISDYVNNTLNITTVAHLPATYLDKFQVENILKSLEKLKITKVLALRGDIFEDVIPKQDFKYASDLIKFIKDYNPNFEVSGACYPEIHPESKNSIEDIHFLKKKVDFGCSKLITQLFFDNEIFYNFQEKCALANINVPILAGIMPIINRKQALRLVGNCQTKLPRKFLSILDKYEHNPIALRDAGLAYAIDQIVDLLTQDVSGIHLYTMNQAQTAERIYSATSSLFSL